MKFIDEYRQSDLAATLAQKIAGLTHQQLKLMEVCGGHTHTIFKYGIEDLLPENIEMIHGPGCPVCVIPLGRVDDAISIALQPNVIFTTFGDAMRVPGSKTSLLDAKAGGADVRMVYSPLDALKIARNNPNRHVVFLTEINIIPDHFTGRGGPVFMKSINKFCIEGRAKWLKIRIPLRTSQEQDMIFVCFANGLCNLFIKWLQ